MTTLKEGTYFNYVPIVHTQLILPNYSFSIRDEINKLQLDKPHPRERRTLAKSSVSSASTLMDSNHCNNIEADTIKVTNETEIKNNDDDSDVQVGDIGEDRLDNKGVEEDDSESVDISSQGPSSLLEKLLAIRQGVKVESTKNNIASDANSDSALLEVEMEFKATKTLNGRQVCLPVSFNTHFILQSDRNNFFHYITYDRFVIFRIIRFMLGALLSAQ